MGTRNSPERVGRMYQDALARAEDKRRHGRPALLRAVLATPGLDADDAMLERLEGGQHLPELHALLEVIERLMERAVGHAEHLGGRDRGGETGRASSDDHKIITAVAFVGSWNVASFTHSIHLCCLVIHRAAIGIR